MYIKENGFYLELLNENICSNLLIGQLPGNQICDYETY